MNTEVMHFLFMLIISQFLKMIAITSKQRWRLREISFKMRNIATGSYASKNDRVEGNILMNKEKGSGEVMYWVGRR